MNPFSTSGLIKGILIMIGGIALLAYVLGMTQKLISLFLIMCACTAIVYGFYTAGLNQYLQKLWNRHR